MADPDYSKLRVVIVDDNLHMRRLLKALLGAFGVGRIVEASDGIEAYDTILAMSPDLILTDYNMDLCDGIALVRRLRTEKSNPNPYVPIIMVTGHTEKHYVEKARDAGATEVLCKPITPANLASRMAHVINRPRPFVRNAGYFGPDRRRRDIKQTFRRRQSDHANAASEASAHFL